MEELAKEEHKVGEEALSDKPETFTHQQVDNQSSHRLVAHHLPAQVKYKALEIKTYLMLTLHQDKHCKTFLLNTIHHWIITKEIMYFSLVIRKMQTSLKSRLYIKTLLKGTILRYMKIEYKKKKPSMATSHIISQAVLLINKRIQK